jgi:copper chaperone CopZ
MRTLLLFTVLFFISLTGNSQGCCSGGAGSPLSGGASTGVLSKNQVELAFTHQYLQSNRFLTSDYQTEALFGRLSSNYMFLRADYGMSDKLTLSVSSGYFLDKSLYELKVEDGIIVEGYDKEELTRSTGFGDLIVFPRYSVYSENEGRSTTELSLGLGLKIPVGSHNDSSLVYTSPTTGTNYYATIPPTVQTTNGSNDFMFYTFFYKGFPHRKLRLFSNALYIKKGWNSLGQKFGDYMSLGVFAGATLFKGFSFTGQLKGELITKMKADENVNMLALYNIDMESTGSRKLLAIPQISYAFKSFTIFALAEIPIYQYLEGTQVGSQYQFTGGLSYRFFVKEPEIDSIITIESDFVEIDEENCEFQRFKVWGNCEMCKDKIESTLKKTSGVIMADWNIESKMLTVEFDHNVTTVDKIKQAIANVGYDTETHRAPNRAYKKLHSCCKYERP